ncbi:MAG: actF [Deltaproteobacteria bacterium]|nr:actF [Deltaproteobacteria bacterium]
MSRSPLVSANVFAGMAALGAVGVVASYLAVPPERFWANWLVWFLFVLTIGVGCLFIVALGHLVAARWSIPIRRAPERVSGLVLLALPMGLIALLSLPVLYPWTRPEALLKPAIAGKAPWLNVPFFSIRVLICFALWLFAYNLFTRGSVRQDQTKDPAFSVRARGFAPAFMIIFAFSITLVAFDWISSLEPEWYSDIFGVYLFAGTFLSGLASSALAVLYLKDRGRLPDVRNDHLYSLGGFMFAFTVFWSYIGFAQYMLMWYGNMPEEIFWYKQRIEGPWLNVILLLAAIHFFVPFFALVPKDRKNDPRNLRWVAMLMLTAHFLDLYWLVLPVVGASPPLSWPELSFALCFVGLAVLWVRRSMAMGADMPIGDPLLHEGLEFRA